MSEGWPDEYRAGGTICCIDCDMSLADSIEAVQSGWSNIVADDSASWAFLGLCPQCQVKQEREESAFYRQRGLLF
jgi:hypothetical protein